MKKLFILSMALMLMLPTLKAQDDELEIEEIEFGKNNISLFLSDVVLTRLSFEYEHIFGDQGNMSINIPVSVALSEVDDVYGDVVKWWAGIGMKLYPTGQGKIRYFVGPEMRIISASDTFYDYHENYNKETTEDMIHTAFLLNNGFIYEPAEHFIFSVNLGVGLISRDQKSNDGIEPLFAPSVRMGFRF